MEGLLQGKVAIITGAGSGVGRAASLLFARHGAKVVSADVDGAAVEATAAEVKAQGGTAIAKTCNVADAAAVDALVKAAVEAFGRLDVMYNNAGITIQNTPGQGSRRFVEAAQADIDRLFAVNVGGVINGCKAAIRQFEAQGGGGVIVNTASVAGLIGYGSVVYGSTKGAITTLTRSVGARGRSAGHPDQLRVSGGHADEVHGHGFVQVAGGAGQHGFESPARSRDRSARLRERCVVPCVGSRIEYHRRESAGGRRPFGRRAAETLVR